MPECVCLPQNSLLPWMSSQTNCLAPHYDRNATEVAGKALELVQSWGEAFRGKHATLPLFLDTYVALKLEGMPFGDLDGEAPKPPVFTPRPSASVSPERPSGGPSISSSSSSAGPREAALSGSPPRPESLLGEARRAAAELRALVEALEVAPHRSGVKLGQGLDGVDAKEGALADRCRNLQTQLSLLVQRGVSEAHLEPMLATNDELLAALAKLDSVRLGGSSGRGSGGGSSTSSSRSSSSSRNSSSTSGGGSGGGGGTSSGIDLMGASAPEKPTEIPRLKPPRSDTPPRPRRAGSGAAAAAEDTPSQANRQSPPQPEPSPFLGLVMDPSPQPAAPSAWPSQGSSNSSLPFGAQGGAQGGARRSRGGASGFEEMGPSGSASGPPAAVPGSSDNPFEALVTEQSQNSKPASRDPFAGLVTDLK